MLLSCLAEQPCRARQGNYPACLDCCVDMETAEPFLQAFANRAQRPYSLSVAGKKPLASLDPKHLDTLKGVCPGLFSVRNRPWYLARPFLRAAPVLTAMALHQNSAKEGHSLMLYFPLLLHLPWQPEHSQREQQRATHFLTGKCHM